MTKYKIEHKREDCIACAACWIECPEFWEQGEDGKSHLKGEANNTLEIEEKDLACNKEAADNCPVNIIHITNLETNEKLI
jgi:ferredoxin